MRFDRIRAIIVVLLLAVVLPGGCSACREQTRPQDVVEVHEKLLQALRSRDPIALYDVSTPELHERLAVLHGRMQRVKAWLDDPEHLGWRNRLGGGLLQDTVSDVRSGRELFVAIVDFHEIDFDDGMAEDLEIAEVEVDGDQALVRTNSRESFVYERDSDHVWKSRLALDALKVWPVYHVLLANLNLVEANMNRLQSSEVPVAPPGAPPH